MLSWSTRASCVFLLFPCVPCYPPLGGVVIIPPAQLNGWRSEAIRKAGLKTRVSISSLPVCVSNSLQCCMLGVSVLHLLPCFPLTCLAGRSLGHFPSLQSHTCQVRRKPNHFHVISLCLPLSTVPLCQTPCLALLPHAIVYMCA